MSGQPLKEIRRVAEEITTREGCYLYDIEFVGGNNGRILRVFIDKEGEGGVSIDDCTKVTRGLNEILDADEEMIPGAYTLEVSSPGLERTLKEPRHFERALGKKISVKSFQPLAQFNENLGADLVKAKQVQGTLLSYDDKGLKVDADGREVFVPMESVTKAHTVFEFTDPSEKTQKKGKPKK